MSNSNRFEVDRLSVERVSLSFDALWQCAQIWGRAQGLECRSNIIQGAPPL